MVSECNDFYFLSWHRTTICHARACPQPCQGFESDTPDVMPLHIHTHQSSCDVMPTMHGIIFFVDLILYKWLKMSVVKQCHSDKPGLEITVIVCHESRNWVLRHALWQKLHPWFSFSFSWNFPINQQMMTAAFLKPNVEKGSLKSSWAPN